VKEETKNATESLPVNAVPESSERIPYHTPTLQRFGGLAELVQRRPGRGRDGSIFPDCTLT
jgi:hypothetical protein